MQEHRLYDSAMFWVTLGGPIAAIGGILAGIGVFQVGSGGNLWANAWFDAGVVVVVLGAAMLLWALVLFLAQRQTGSARRVGVGSREAAEVPVMGTPDLDLQPSSGPSPDLRIAVTNRRSDAEIRVTGRVIGRKNDPNPVRRTAFSLTWMSNQQTALLVRHGHTENVLVAKFEILPPEGVIERMGEMRVIEFQADGPQVVTWARWNFYKPYQPLLPEIHLELSFHVQGYASPLVRSYALRPEGQYGPLELVPLTDEHDSARPVESPRVSVVDSPLAMIARRPGFGPGPPTDISVSITENEWNRTPQGRMILRMRVRIKNSNDGAIRTIQQHWLLCPGFPQVNFGRISLQRPGLSQEVGPIKPGETVEGQIFCELPNAGPTGPLLYDLFLEDDLGRVIQATKR
jgi:hypothetical protein